MGIIVFETRKGIPKVNRIEAEKQTGHSVYINGRRRAKRSQWDNYYATWEEAKDAMCNGARGKVALCRRRLEKAETFLKSIHRLLPTVKDVRRDHPVKPSDQA